jgi:hypothetical protein
MAQLIVFASSKRVRAGLFVIRNDLKIPDWYKVMPCGLFRRHSLVVVPDGQYEAVVQALGARKLRTG